MVSFRSEVLIKILMLSSLLKLIPTGKDMKAPFGKCPGLTLSMKMSWPLVGTTGESVSGSNNKASGSRLTKSNLRLLLTASHGLLGSTDSSLLLALTKVKFTP